MKGSQIGDKKIKDMDKAMEDSNPKLPHKLIQKMTKIKENSPILKSVVEGEECIYDPIEIEEKAKIYYQGLFNREGA